MLVTKERPRAIRTLRGWAISVLQEAGAIRECEEHGWMQDRADPHALEHAFDIARQDTPAGISPDEAVTEISEVLASIGTPARNARRNSGHRPRGPLQRPEALLHPFASIADLLDGLQRHLRCRNALHYASMTTRCNSTRSISSCSAGRICASCRCAA